MFFLALLRASSHSPLALAVEIEGIAPKGIGFLNPWEIPFLNTHILPPSRVSVTWAHHVIPVGKEQQAVSASIATISLALVSTRF
eukprot:Gb_22011 [translate_table: standard]